MNSVISIVTPPVVTRLTTVDRAKQELDITDSNSDALIGAKLDEVTSVIEAHANRIFSRATIAQTFWGGAGCADFLTLDRYPVASIVSVLVDGDAVASGELRLDSAAGILYRLDADGYESVWRWDRSIAATYAAGYLMPGENNRDLPRAIEAAAIDLLQWYWFSRNKDPMIKAEDVPGLGRVERWVGSVADSGKLPPSVEAKLAPYRSIRII